jgi:hydroxymethylglutaryl-CoA lyase
MPISLHFHNTRGVGLANVMVGLDLGIREFESSIAGLGGCPFAPGATGNICTEDLVYLLEESGFDTGIDLPALIEVAQRVEGVIGRTLPGQVMKAGRDCASIPSRAPSAPSADSSSLIIFKEEVPWFA